MKEFSYVLFDEYNTFTDFNLYIEKLEITGAQVKTNIVDIPGADGELDFSYSLTGEAKFQNRRINITCANLKRYFTLQEYSRVQNAIHGKKMRIRLSKDLNFYYEGKVSVNKYEANGLIREILIECNVEPYKYDLFSSDEDWEWNPFDFETGIINETKDLEVNGELEVTILGRRQKVVPKFVCENALQLLFNEQTYNLPSGESYSPDIEICEGENTLKFVGNGTITIEYRGGSL